MNSLPSSQPGRIALNDLSMPFGELQNNKLDAKNGKTKTTATPLRKTKLSLIDATCNAIISHAFNQVLPIGTVEVKSVQHLSSPLTVGESKTTAPNEHAISITNTVISPAKFINSISYGDLSPADQRLETFRIREAYRELNNAFKSEHSFSQFITRSLDNCARQCSYCYVHGISLGSISPESLTIDGQWARLIEAGVDISRTSSTPDTLHQEHNEIASVFIKWACYYNSFNKTNIDTQCLLQFFNDKYNQYLERYVFEFIGLDSEITNFATLPAERNFLLKLLHATVQKLSSPVYSNEQRVHLLVNELMSFMESNRSMNNTRQTRLMKTVSEFVRSPHTTNSQRIICTIKAGRRFIFSEALANQSIRDTVSAVIEHKGVNNLESLAEKYRELTSWLFNKLDSSVHTTIFINNHIRCYFVPVTESYVFESFDDGVRFSFLQLDELSNYIKSQNKLAFHLPGFHGYKGLMTLLELLKKVDSKK
ncbi:hypothetical protein J1N51_10945 [Psychrosphaera ytuae]|uniref:Uncharacterized protein n=1 Tax=Psychrosphaera ytuae TaxID=2820710 RepID=A0A975DCR1_9GAMM|nr:hypothetical protein [Psychrosphaera ytuae]QTH63250.1 hypothetical protein J1N51_10945 [Psychrosphaera ytuae]